MKWPDSDIFTSGDSGSGVVLNVEFWWTSLYPWLSLARARQSEPFIGSRIWRDTGLSLQRTDWSVVKQSKYSIIKFFLQIGFFKVRLSFDQRNMKACLVVSCDSKHVHNQWHENLKYLHNKYLTLKYLAGTLFKIVLHCDTRC